MAFKMVIRLAVFDVDGTLLRGDTACQTIARELGKFDRMCEMEGLSAREDVMAARVEMAGWYMNAGREITESTLDRLNWAPGAFEGIAELKSAGVHVALASITWTFAVEHIASKLGLTDYRGTYLDFETGVIEQAWGSTKADFLADLQQAHGISSEETAGIGDSSGDLEMLAASGLPVFVGADPPDVEGLHHMPDADIREVASTILKYGK